MRGESSACWMWNCGSYWENGGGDNDDDNLAGAVVGAVGMIR